MMADQLDRAGIALAFNRLQRDGESDGPVEPDHDVLTTD
jgi:hypothetical protein